MFGYYLRLAWRSFRRNKVLTALMVLSIAVGIGASMTTLTVMHLLSGDPLAGRSDRIFYPQVDVDPSNREMGEPLDMLDYTTAMDLWQSKRADRQALVNDSEIKVQAPSTDVPAAMTTLLSTTSDFFPMFDVPFAHGGAWRDEDDQRRARVAVISSDLNAKLFGGANSVGRTLRVRDADVRIVGVLAPWRPSPQFYTVAGGRFAHGQTAEYYARPEDVMMPMSAALDVNAGNFQQFTCWKVPDEKERMEVRPCVWLSLWVQLDDGAKVVAYRQYLANYAAEQVARGRIRNAGNTRLRNLTQWLDYNGVVPGDVKLQTWLSLAFLAICLFNTVGLLLAKFLRRSGEIGVRRALGASRGAVFAQCLAEAGLIGLVGGAFGLLLTLLGLWAMRQQPVAYADLARLDVTMFCVTFVAAVASSLVAGAVPALRASRIAPALQLKVL